MVSSLQITIFGVFPGVFPWENPRPRHGFPHGCSHQVYGPDGEPQCLEPPTASPMPRDEARQRRWICEHRWQGVAGAGKSGCFMGFTVDLRWIYSGFMSIYVNLCKFMCFLGVFHGIWKRLPWDLLMGFSRGFHCRFSGDFMGTYQVYETCWDVGHFSCDVIFICFFVV